MDLVVQHRHLAGLVGKVLAFDELVTVVGPRVRQDFEIRPATRTRHMRRIGIGLDVRRVVRGRDVPGPLVGERLLEEMLRLDGHDAVRFVEDEIRRGDRCRRVVCKCSWSHCQRNNGHQDSSKWFHGDWFPG